MAAKLDMTERLLFPMFFDVSDTMTCELEVEVRYWGTAADSIDWEITRYWVDDSEHKYEGDPQHPCKMEAFVLYQVDEVIDEEHLKELFEDHAVTDSPIRNWLGYKVSPEWLS